MRILCLAWGSLVWKPGVVPVTGDWQPDGPSLPIEFARVGDAGELATVITPTQTHSTVCWSALDETDPEAARRLLRQREGIERGADVGAVVVGRPAGALACAPEILRWLTDRGDADAVIWTALPPRFDRITGRVPSPSDAVRYLRGLDGKERLHAEDYVRRVPPGIQTRNRRALEEVIAASP